MSEKIVISSLAINQTVFWCRVCLNLLEKGFDVCLLVFDQESADYLEGKEVSFFMPDHDAVDVSDRHRLLSDKMFTEKGKYFNHERYAFGVSDIRSQYLKYSSFRNQIKEYFLKVGCPDVVIQELGGFVSNIALFDFSRSVNASHYFIEPSFFRGRFFMVPDKYSSITISPSDKDCIDQVKNYVDGVIEDQSIVIPKKDAGHYTSVVFKIFKVKVFQRFFQKLYKIYFKGQYFEFGHVRHHVLTHLRMLLNSFLMQPYYSGFEPEDKVCYFPMHVPADVALTLRSDKHVNQLAIVERICQIAPPDWKVVIKEHPAKIGSIELPVLKRLKKLYTNLVVINPNVNNHSVLKSSDLVVTVNSKSGLEALLHAVPCAVLGDAFYRGGGVTQDIDDVSEIDFDELGQVDVDQLYNFLNDVYGHTYLGELYENSANNVEAFSDSLVQAIQ